MAKFSFGYINEQKTDASFKECKEPEKTELYEITGISEDKAAVAFYTVSSDRSSYPDAETEAKMTREEALKIINDENLRGYIYLRIEIIMKKNFIMNRKH